MPSAYTFSPYPTMYTQPRATMPYIKQIYIGSSTKTQYEVGDSFDMRRTFVYGVYSDNTVQQLSGWAPSGFDSSSAGSRVIWINYNGLRIAFNVYITDPSATTPPTDPTSPTSATQPDETTPTDDQTPDDTSNEE